MGHKAGRRRQRSPAHEPLTIVVLSLLSSNDNLPAPPRRIFRGAGKRKNITRITVVYIFFFFFRALFDSSPRFVFALENKN